MSDFIEALKEFANAVINTISTYAHSDWAYVINTNVAEAVKYVSDTAVTITREFLDIFGR